MLVRVIFHVISCVMENVVLKVSRCYEQLGCKVAVEMNRPVNYVVLRIGKDVAHQGRIQI